MYKKIILIAVRNTDINFLCIRMNNFYNNNDSNGMKGKQ